MIGSSYQRKTLLNNDIRYEMFGIFGFWLQNPTDKREIICDEKLKSLFEGKDKVGFLEIGKLLTSHFIKTA